ncbi:MAG TPA: protein-disulfide reductase DsbD domain-containing protein [Rhizomicrobium sp.]
MRGYFLRVLIATVLAGPWLLEPVHAASTVQIDHVKLSISLEAPSKSESTVWVAIQQVIAPGWHTYWRNPGDSGLATSVSWFLPKGVTAGVPQWPTPHQFMTGSIVNYGYADEATLLVPLTVARNATIGAAPARVHLFLLECAQMCIPEQTTLDLDLSNASGSHAIFAEARAALPRVFGGSAHIATGANILTLTLVGPVLTGIKAEAAHFYPATIQTVDCDVSPSTHINGDTLIWKAARPLHAKPVSKFEGVLDVPGVGAFAISATPTAAPVAPISRSDDLTLAEAVVLAFLGGLILNLMPCVLPILSMKALALAQSGGNSRVLRRDGAFYFAGVLATFTAIAILLLLLKAGGAVLGWGFQLQSPLVVFAMAMLMTAIGLNLLGVFEVPPSLAGIGNDFTRAKGGQGAFFTGMLAVLVASPCTAPFMGTALGYAFTQSTAFAVVVLLALGAGFALPISALALMPALVRLVPKPGPWMVRFKEFLAFPMFATAIWLIWVLSKQVGSGGLVVALSAGLGLVFLLWLLPLLIPWPRRIAGVAGLAALIALSLRIQIAPEPDRWAPWSTGAVMDARRAGKPVLVDLSAAWCVTCLVNERVALGDTAVVTRLQHDGVVTLKGDWTNGNPAITIELGRYGRSGVPLYLLYPPDLRARAIALPQLLTPSLVLSALEKMEAARRAL